MVARGMREDMARLTLARKFAALTLRLWKTGEALRSDEADDAGDITGSLEAKPCG
jgi:hypothetical protein